MAGHRRAEATPSLGRLCPAMTEKRMLLKRFGASSIDLPRLQFGFRRPDEAEFRVSLLTGA
jgi:hypothetical protein